MVVSQVELPPRTGQTTAGLAHALGIDDSDSPIAAIDWSQVNRVSEHIVRRREFYRFKPAAWDDDNFWNVSGTPAERSQFFAIGNAVNFRFWTLEEGEVRPAVGTLDGSVYRGSMYMWRALRRALDTTSGRLLDAGFLAELSDLDFDGIFADDFGDNPLDVARGDRIANLRDLGAGLLADWNGAFLELVDASHGSLVEFSRLSRSFRAFDDPIFKLTMVNAIVHSGSRVQRWSDEPLPAIDYHLLKQCLRQGLVRPNHRVAEKLKASELLTGTEAGELRRLALVALVAISERTGISGEILDNKYWLNRVNCKDSDPVCLDPRTAANCPFYGAGVQATEFALPLELTRYY